MELKDFNKDQASVSGKWSLDTLNETLSLVFEDGKRETWTTPQRAYEFALSACKAFLMYNGIVTEHNTESMAIADKVAKALKDLE